MIVGNDVSHWQGDINFDVYKNNSNFLIIKTSEGTSGVDDKFSRNQFESRRVGLPVGYYHFARPDVGNSAVNEAEWFLKTCGSPVDGELYVLDYEPPRWTGDEVAWCKTFLDKVQEKIGVKALIYLNQSQTSTLDWSPVVAGGYGLWLASYTGSPTNNTGKTGKWGTMVMQQWTNNQTVPGISGAVDGDCFFGDVGQFKKYGYKSPPPPIVPTYNCDEIKAELEQIKLDQPGIIKQAVDTAITENNKLWQSKLDSANAVIDTLKNGLAENLTYSQLFSIAWKKFWAIKKAGG